jgi:hypothetical protein
MLFPAAGGPCPFKTQAAANGMRSDSKFLWACLAVAIACTAKLAVISGGNIAGSAESELLSRSDYKTTFLRDGYSDFHKLVGSITDLVMVIAGLSSLGKLCVAVYSEVLTKARIDFLESMLKRGQQLIQTTVSRIMAGKYLLRTLIQLSGWP